MPTEIALDPGATWRIPGEPWERSWNRMVELALLAKEAGANTLKPQFLRRGMYQDNTQAAALVAQYEMPTDWLASLRLLCDQHSLNFLITPYRAEDVATLDPYVDRWKIAGFDAGNDALLRAVLATGKPIIVSLSLGQNHCLAFREAFGRTTVLHCVSAYPTPDNEMNLAVLAQSTGSCGLSDHSLGHHAAVMAMALGAIYIEKHIRHPETPPNNPDYAAALAPEALFEYVQAIRQAEVLLGDGRHRVMPSELAQYRYDKETGRRGGE